MLSALSVRCCSRGETALTALGSATLLPPPPLAMLSRGSAGAPADMEEQEPFSPLIFSVTSIAPEQFEELEAPPPQPPEV